MEKRIVKEVYNGNTDFIENTKNDAIIRKKLIIQPTREAVFIIL